MPPEPSSPASRPRAVPRLAVNVRWTFLGTVAYAVGTWLVVIILARASGAAAVGTYAFAVALTTPIMSFAGLGQRLLLASDATAAFSFAEYMTVTAAATALGALASIAVALLGGDGGAGWAVLGGVLVMRAAESLAEIYFALWQRHERMAVLGAARVLQSVVTVAAVLAATWMGGGVAGAAVGGALGGLALLAFMHLRTAADAELRRAMLARAAGMAAARVAALTRQGMPLAVIQLLGALQASIPRWFIERYVGHAALGLFASASQLTASGNTVVGAVGSAALPRLASWHAEGNASFRALARRMVLWGALLGVAGVAASALVGRQVLVLVYRPEFGAAWHVLVVLSVAAGVGFVAQFLGWVLTAARIIPVQPLILAVMLAALLGACAVLVPRYGAVGAGWALAIASAVHAIANRVALRGSKVVAGARRR